MSECLALGTKAGRDGLHAVIVIIVLVVNIVTVILAIIICTCICLYAVSQVFVLACLTRATREKRSFCASLRSQDFFRPSRL